MYLTDQLSPPPNNPKIISCQKRTHNCTPSEFKFHQRLTNAIKQHLETILNETFFKQIYAAY